MPGDSSPLSTIPFVSCDWGTTSFRLRLCGGAGGTVTEVSSDQGAARIAAATSGGVDRAEAFQSALMTGLRRLGAPSGLPVLISGMAGSSIGWKELPYARIPFRLDGSDLLSAEILPGVHLFSGLRGETEMLRGEETQAVGMAVLLGGRLPDRATFVLPGTHSKHLSIRSGSIVGIRTFMTGELFDVLSRSSVLRHTTDPDAAPDRPAFLDGIHASRTRPLTESLFQVRTRQVLGGCTSGSNASFLSGLLIGTELGSLLDADLEQVPLILAAGDVLRDCYLAGADALGLGARVVAMDSGRLTEAGQGCVVERLLEASRRRHEQ